MQQASESNQGTSETTAPPLKSVDGLDDSNLVTESAAAARKCPECGALMTPEEKDGKPVIACTECAYFEEYPEDNATAAKTEEPKAEAQPTPVRCERCGLELVIKRLPSGHGFEVVSGADPGQTFGISANGFPVCPKDGVALIPTGPMPIGEAFKHVTDALKDIDEEPARLPFPAPAFDSAKAFHAIVRQNAEVEVKRRKHEDLKGKASAAKKDLDDEEALLSRMISEYARNEKDAENAARGKLAPGQVSVCFTERQTGEPCPVCREERAKAKKAGSNEPNDRLISVQQHAARRGFHLDLDEELLVIQRDAPETFDALEKWAHDTDAPAVDSVKLETSFPLLVELVKRSCIAGPVGERGHQRCTKCGALVHTRSEEQEGQASYPEGDSVGLGCEGTPGEETSADAQPEPARQVQRRHKSPKDAAVAKSKAAKSAKRQKRARG